MTEGKVDQHARPSQETPLTDPDVRAPTHGERARSLVAMQKTGVLSTLSPEGFPHGSYVTFAVDGEGAPIFLVSRLATHTKQLMEDTRASLLVNESRCEDPLANGRVTLLGRCARVEEEAAIAATRASFLARHPGASYYVDFKDFSFWRLAVQEIRYIGGYGRMSWVDASDWHQAAPDPLRESAQGIIDHMNADHADANVAYARAFTRATEAEEASMTGVDQYGFELSVKTERGPRPARIAFDATVHSADECRKALIALLQKARK